MTRTQHLVLAALFVAVNLTGALVNTQRAPDRALDDSNYEEASDAELAAAYVDAPIVCVAASTVSGCAS